MNARLNDDRFAAALDQAPSLAGAVLELLRSIDDDRLDVASLARKIGHDPVLSARVLKIVNSPFYGAPGQVASLHEAVMVLGFSHVRRLVLAASLSSAFVPPRGSATAEPRRLWRHAFSAALCAQALAPAACLDGGTAFTAGLLLDIGRIALLAAPADAPAAALPCNGEYAEEAAEIAAYGFTHAELGARLIERWRLPPALVHAVEFHHRPDGVAAHPLTDLGSICDRLAHVVGDDADAGDAGAGAGGACLRLGLTWTQCLERVAPVAAQVEAFATLL